MKIKRYIPLIIICFFVLALLILFLYMSSNIDYERDELLFQGANQSSVITLYIDEGDCTDIKGYKPQLREEVCLSEYENKWVDITDVPKALIDAFLCTEDRNYYKHSGVNLPRTLKALINHITKRDKRFGGSTITQQVVKNISGDNEFSIQRKMDEILRAYALERRHSKDEILEMYLNIIPMGDRLVGVRAAAEEYFNKDVADLSVSECATLVAITNAPSKYHPVRCTQACKQKRNVVLGSLYECGCITQEEYILACSEDLTVSKKAAKDANIASWFAETVLEQVKEDLLKSGMTPQAVTFLMAHGGLKIYTTEDVDATNALHEVFYNETVQHKIENDSLETAMVIINNETGYLSAILGNGKVKEANRLLNHVTDAPHTPGSSLKPIALYAPLLDRNKIHWATVYDDIPLEFIKDGVEYRTYPHNLPERYDGLTTVKDALRNSKNTIAIKLFQALGQEEIYSHLTGTLGFLHIVRQRQKSDGTIVTDLAPSPLALGQLSYGATLKELTDAYTAFPRDGKFTESKGYIAVYDKDENLILKNEGKEKQIYRRETARLMNQMLSEVVKDGTAKAIRLKNYVDTAGKTGTSGDDKDRLFIGYTPYYTAGIWMGKSDAAVSIGNASVSHLKLWDDTMTYLHMKKYGESEILSAFSTGGLIRSKYCMDSGCIPCDKCKKDLRGERIEEGYFTIDNMPRGLCTAHFTVLYDELCDAIATEGCFLGGEIREISLVKMPKRSFPVEVVISDAEYMGIEDFDFEKIPDSFDVPYFQYALDDGIFVGRGKNKKQKNSACYFHKDEE